MTDDGDKPNLGDGPHRLLRWARYVPDRPGRYCADAERVARELLTIEDPEPPENHPNLVRSSKRRAQRRPNRRRE